MRARPPVAAHGLDRRVVRAIRIGLACVLAFAGLRLLIVHSDPERKPSREGGFGHRGRRIDGPRGSILARDGQPLARSVLAWDVLVECYANGDFPPRLARDAIAALEKDRPLGQDDRKRIVGLFRLPEPGRRKDLARAHPERHRPWRFYWRRYLAKGVHARVALEALRALGRARIPGFFYRLQFQQTWKRVYPLGRSASHVVGCVAATGDGGVVCTGLEAMPILATGPSRRYALRRSARGVAYADGGRSLPVVEDVEMARVRTTLDADLTQHAFRRLDEAVVDAGARWGMMVLVELGTGDILALVGSPSFEPEYRRRGEQYWPMTHQARFEPGSVIKPLIVALALDRGIVGPRETIRCEGDTGGRVWRIRRGRSTRTIVDDHYVGNVSLAQLMIQSSNIGAVRIGRRGGPAFHRELLQLYRLQEAPRLGLPLPRRRSGRILGGTVPGEERLANRRQYDLYTGPSLSFGYELNIYPLTFAAAFCTVVSGREFKLRLVRELEEAGGPRRAVPVAGPGPRVFSERTVRWMRRTMSGVVAHARGTAHAYIAGPGVDGVIAGKTGTAVRVVGGRRVSNASFCGFAPASDPRYLALAVLQKNDAHGFYGGKFAAPAVKDVLLYVLARDERLRLERRDAATLVRPSRTRGGARGGGRSQGPSERQSPDERPGRRE